jgi:predicted RNase H-like HicB family nuclease
MTTEIAKRINDYLLVIEGGPPTNYSVFSPDVPGCVATGDTIDETVDQMREALTFHLELAAEYDEPIPEPSGPGVYIDEHAVA